MQVQAETYLDEGGVEKVRRFRLDGRIFEVADNIDQWHGPAYCYAKVGDNAGGVYILRFDEARSEWELIMYRHAQPRASRARFRPAIILTH